VNVRWKKQTQILNYLFYINKTIILISGSGNLFKINFFIKLYNLHVYIKKIVKYALINEKWSEMQNIQQTILNI